MDEQANIKLVQQCYDAFTKGDIPRLMTYMAPDIDWELPELQAAPFTGKRHGQDQVKEFFRMVGDMQILLQFKPMEYIAQGDRVVVLGQHEWAVKSTGKSFDSDWVHVFTIRDGKVSQFRELSDTHKAALAFESQPENLLGTAAQPETNRPSVH